MLLAVASCNQASKTAEESTSNEPSAEVNEYYQQLFNFRKQKDKTVVKEGIIEKDLLIQETESILGGWVIACLGSKRIITRKIDYKKINYTFDKISF